MRIHATTLLNHVQVEMSQRCINNRKSTFASQYGSLCGPKPGSKATMQKMKNIDSEYLLRDDLEIAAKKVKTSKDMLKETSN